MNPCTALKPLHRWSSLASAVLYWFQESDMVFWRSACFRKSLMVRTVFILLWDYNYRRGLSDDICLFSAPIPTSTFMRVVLCIHGMACHDMTWPRLSIRWKRGAYSSHLMCRQRATRNRAAMRAAYLVMMAFRWGQDVLTISGMSAMSCLAC